MRVVSTYRRERSKRLVSVCIGLLVLHVGSLPERVVERTGAAREPTRRPDPSEFDDAAREQSPQFARLVRCARRSASTRRTPYRVALLRSGWAFARSPLDVPPVPLRRVWVGVLGKRPGFDRVSELIRDPADRSRTGASDYPWYVARSRSPLAARAVAGSPCGLRAALRKATISQREPTVSKQRASQKGEPLS